MTQEEKRLVKRWEAEGYAYRFCSICGRVWQVSKGTGGRYTCPTRERKGKKMKLTKETAKKVIHKVIPHGEVGTRTPGESYVCDSGMLTVYCDSDWFTRNGKICVDIRADFADEVITLFFDPETLERDYDAEDKWRKIK